MTKKHDEAELTLDGVPLGFSDADLERDMRKIAEDIEADGPMKTVAGAPLDMLIPVEDIHLPEIEPPEAGISDVDFPEIDIPGIGLMLAELDHV